LPECLDDFIDDSNPVRVIDAFVDTLDLAEMRFEGAEPAATGRPSYHPSVLLKLYIYGYLNRVQSSRRLEREAGRNVEVMWLLGRLAPNHKTIADFRKDNGLGLREVCARFVELCREMGLLAISLMPTTTEEKDHVYKILELVGSSEKSIEDAIQNAVSRASKTIRGMKWFEVSQMRGHIEDGSVRHYQVPLRVGFTIEH